MRRDPLIIGRAAIAAELGVCANTVSTYFKRGWLPGAFRTADRGAIKITRRALDRVRKGPRH